MSEQAERFTRCPVDGTQITYHDLIDTLVYDVREDRCECTSMDETHVFGLEWVQDPETRRWSWYARPLQPGEEW